MTEYSFIKKVCPPCLDQGRNQEVTLYGDFKQVERAIQPEVEIEKDELRFYGTKVEYTADKLKYSFSPRFDRRDKGKGKIRVTINVGRGDDEQSDTHDFTLGCSDDAPDCSESAAPGGFKESTPTTGQPGADYGEPVAR